MIGHYRDPIHPFSDSDMLVRELPNARLLQASSILELRLTPERLTSEIVEFIERLLQAGAKAPGPSPAARGRLGRAHAAALRLGVQLRALHYPSPPCLTAESRRRRCAASARSASSQARAAEQRKKMVGYGAGGSVLAIAVVVVLVLLATRRRRRRQRRPGGRGLPGRRQLPGADVFDVGPAAKAAGCELQT